MGINTKSLFITATGTDIGKTYVSALLVKKMRELGLNCGYFKPVLSGYDELTNDCKFVTDVSGLKEQPLDCLSYCFDDAVSPHLAAKRAGVNISVEKILADYKNVSANYDYMVLEGAGGVTCPIIVNDEKTYLMWNLIKDMDVNVLVVADGGLGTINSVLTTVEYLQNRGIKIKGIILNNYDKLDFMHRDNFSMVEKLTGIDVVATVGLNASDIDISVDVLKGLFEE